jgi:isocitrate/isopropylmalate dehydrogenase
VIKTVVLIALSLLPLSAQEFKFPESIDKLAARAKETVNVSLDGAMLQFAGNFLSGKHAEEAKIKQLTANLKGLYVRNFEFSKEGEYGDADLAPLRSQLAGARGWSRIVDVAEAGEHTEVYARKESDKIVGMAVIAAEKRELTVVYIDGPIDLKQLTELVNVSFNWDLGSAGKK